MRHSQSKLMESPNSPDGSDDVLIEKIRDTCSLDSKNCNILGVKPLLNLMNFIFNRIPDDPSLIFKDFQTQFPDQSMYQQLPTRVIETISCEILSKCWDAKVDVHAITMEILDITKHYNWDAKAVLALLAFSVTFSEFRLVVQLYSTGSVFAKAIALLKQLTELILTEHELEMFFSLIGEVFYVTKKIVEFYDFPLHNYFTDASPQIAENSYIPVAVYWAIRSIVVSATQIFSFTSNSKRIELLKREQLESTQKLIQKLNNMKNHLVELIECRNRSIESKTVDAYQDISENSKSLTILFGKSGLYDCYNKKKISIEHLKSKVVALFITDLDIDLTTGAEYAILQQMYLEKWHNPTTPLGKFEVVWVPIVHNNNWTRDELERFKSLREQMEWHSVDNPSNVDLMVVKFIIEQLNVFENSILVVMDSQGKIVHMNGIYMMCTWGSLAYPFTTGREQLLWEEMRWSIELLVDDMELNTDVWIKEGKHICLYGGVDVKWIKKFTKIAKDVANVADISLELLYVGKSKLKKGLVNIIDIIQKENISKTLDWKIIWYFWVRLESMLYSKKLTRREECDSIMQKIFALLSFDSEHQNWAILSNGCGEMVMAKGEHMLNGLYKLWKMKSRENNTDLVHGLAEYINETCPVPAAPENYASHMLSATVSKKHYEVFKVVECLLDTTNIHDSESIGVLFRYKYDNRPLINDFYKKKQISNNNLRRKIVVLFITELDPELPHGLEYVTLQKIYLEKWHNPIETECHYDLVWVPVVAGLWDNYKNELFESLKDHMNWLSVHHPLMVPPVVIRYIKNRWKFSKKPLVVVMDKQGEIVHENAIHMMCIWRSRAYPFSINHEQFMWEKTSLSIDLLVDNLEPNIVSWLQGGRHICLYGGEDIDWIQKFTKIAKDVAMKAGITLELLYVGKSNPTERVKNIIETISQKNLSGTLEWNHICFFWMRLKSMRKSKRQLFESKNLINDPIIKGITEMQSYDSIEQGWAVISGGSDKMVWSSGEQMCDALVKHEMWKSKKDEIGFVPALDKYLHSLQLNLRQHATKKEDEANFEVVQRIFASTHTDNSKPLNALFQYKDGRPALYDRYRNKRITTKKLREKVVALFITDIDPELTLRTEYKILRLMYLEKRNNLKRAECPPHYEVVWVPIADNWDDKKYLTFETLRGQMEWCYSVHHPSVVSGGVIRYIKEKWNFNKNPILVVMDNQGKVVHQNAIHMICHRGIQAYPFSSHKEISMWEHESWSFELLAESLGPNIRTLLQQRRSHICLYGGEDEKRMQMFTRTAKEVAGKAGISLELFYVGRKEPMKNEGVVKKIKNNIRKESLSKTFDFELIWYFWTRLESMLYSRQQFNETHGVKADPIMDGIMEMLSYGSSDQGWVVIGGESNQMIMATMENMLTTLLDHRHWMSSQDKSGFLSDLDKHLKMMQQTQDNIKVLTQLSQYKDGQTALYDCYRKKMIAAEELKGKIVALFITELDPELTCLQEYAILQQMYMEKRHSATRTESQYDVVWVPITDNWTDEKYRQFERLRDQMEWYSVHHPSVLTRVVHRFIREKWNFSKKPLLVVIDTQRRVVHLNAIHMMCIWGSLSYPFTTNREKLLWDETSWTIDLIVDGLDPNVVTWIQEQRHICLYGGEDIDWIRKFTRVAKEVARESGISLELLYVGKSKPHEKATRNIIETLIKENLSRTLDWNLIWYFWVRLESMWHSKGQLTTLESVKTDLVMQGIIAMLSYGSSSQGWAVISRGYGEMVKASGEHIYKGLSEHGRWKPREDEIGFVPALDEHLKKIHLDTPHHCTSLILPATGAVSDTVACSECGRLMERFTMFRCYLDY